MQFLQQYVVRLVPISVSTLFVLMHWGSPIFQPKTKQYKMVHPSGSIVVLVIIL